MDLNDLRVFRAVAAAGSFTGGARVLGLDKARVSRIVARLEVAVGAPLVARTTRSFALTPAGQELLALVTSPLAALENAAGAVKDRPAAPAGLVTLTTTADLGRVLVAPLLAGFRARHPGITLRLALASGIVAVEQGEADLALRVGKGPSGALKVRKLADLEAGFFAAPRYLAARGTPRSASDLAGHDGLWPAHHGGRRSFAGPARPPPPAIDCDDFGVLAELARSGAGIAVLPTFLAARDVTEGALVRVLPSATLGGAPLFVVTPPARPLAPRVAALRSFLVETLPSALGRHGR